MGIYPGISSFYPGFEKTSAARKAYGRQETSGRPASGNKAKGKRDFVEISAEAYEMQGGEEKMSASSGKDTLGISKGSDENSYIIHFSDSAMVSRALARGYITVNGRELPLSDAVKKQLADMDRQAQADRETAYYRYIMEHETAALRQQGETLAKSQKDMIEAYKIAARISRGEKVSSADMKKLMETNPQLYAMAMALRNTEEKKERPDKKGILQEEERTQAGRTQGVSWSEFEWKTYETQMEVSVKETVSVEAVTEGEVLLSQ